MLHNWGPRFMKGDVYPVSALLLEFKKATGSEDDR